MRFYSSLKNSFKSRFGPLSSRTKSSLWLDSHRLTDSEAVQSDAQRRS